MQKSFSWGIFDIEIKPTAKDCQLFIIFAPLNFETL